jgi:uncharacterized flavoprotein (TIGR03862 family)
MPTMHPNAQSAEMPSHPSDTATPPTGAADQLSATATHETDIAIVGGGPAGLMAAEVCAQAGLQVDLFERMPSTGRKFLLAGKGGLNLTHAEPWADFLTRYESRTSALATLLLRFDSSRVRQWAQALGIDTFVGTSNRVFPTSMKAAPLLRAWLSRLRAQGVRIHVRHRWTGWGRELGSGPLRLATSGDREPCSLFFETPAGALRVRARAVVLALGGASWPQLGSDGRWVEALEAVGVSVAPLEPANCGFDLADGWSGIFGERYAGEPLKTVRLKFGDFDRKGECVVTQSGVEGSLVYAASAAIRRAIGQDGHAEIHIDLLPDLTLEQIRRQLGKPRGSQSFTNHLRRTIGLAGVKAALLRESMLKLGAPAHDPNRLASLLKNLPLRLIRPRPIAEAISTAGGVRFESLNPSLMLTAHPGVFVAGEMLDWEAPTGGYLLTACFATGHQAGWSAAEWVTRPPLHREGSDGSALSGARTAAPERDGPSRAP